MQGYLIVVSDTHLLSVDGVEPSRRNRSHGNPAVEAFAESFMVNRMGSPPRIVVAICTYKRNEPLQTLLSALVKVAETARERATVGVVVVDDNPDQRARVVVDDFGGVFALGIRYRTSGKRNISIARNIAINTASEDADWVAMVDDDCEPEPTWLCAYLDVLETTGADCATGPMNLRVPAGSPSWLHEQPFFDDVRLKLENAAPMDVAATNNSIIRASFLRQHPQIRFNPEFGKLGGEDMVFYRRAHGAGLTIRFAKRAGVWGNEPPDRATFRHQIMYRFWLGNSMFVTNRYFGASRARLFLRGSKILALALVRPFIRVLQLSSPQWRYCVASSATGVGLIIGVFGLRKEH
jgi:succinoglycan biosynthesis protein ExoM